MGAVADDDQSRTSSSGKSEDSTWIPWFCSLKGNEFFCRVDVTFLQDGFNLTGLSSQVPYYDQALDMVIDIEQADTMNEEQQELIENDAENLYGLVHARFILTTRGLQAMHEKFKRAEFGRCPRVLCRGQATLPVGVTDTTNQESVKLYCPSCEDVFLPRSTRHDHIDGAYFGTTFAHLFFLTYPEMKPQPSTAKYVPRVFGFKVHKSAYAHSLEYNARNKRTEKEKAQQPAA